MIRLGRRDVYEQWADFVGDQDLALSRAVPKAMMGPAPDLAGATCRNGGGASAPGRSRRLAARR